MRRLLGTVVMALAVVVLVSCSSGGDEAASNGGAGGGVSEPEVVGPEGAPVVDTDDADRQVVTTASASLAVEDPAQSAQQISELVESAGGRVDQRSEQAAGDDEFEGAYAELVVRVPADGLTDVLADLEDLGEVVDVSVSRSDVTATAVDLDARISALQTSVARLQALIDRAADTSDLLAAEKALSERQAELESLQSQRGLLADQVEMSTLNVFLEPFGVAPAGGPDGFLDGLATGWRSLVSALGAAVVVLGVVLPWLVVLALVAGAVLLPFRAARRRAAAQVVVPPPQA